MNEEFVGPRRPRGRPRKGTHINSTRARAARRTRLNRSSDPAWREQRANYMKLWRTEEGRVGFTQVADDAFRLQHRIYHQLRRLADKDPE